MVRERVAVLEVAPGPPAPALPADFEGNRPLAAPADGRRPCPPSRPDRSPRRSTPNGAVRRPPALPEAVASADLDRIKPDPEPAEPAGDPCLGPTRAGDPGRPDRPRDADRVRRPPRPVSDRRPASRSVDPRRGRPRRPGRRPPAAPRGRRPRPTSTGSTPEPGPASGQAPHVAPEPIRDAQLARTRFEPLERRGPMRHRTHAFGRLDRRRARRLDARRGRGADAAAGPMLASSRPTSAPPSEVPQGRSSSAEAWTDSRPSTPAPIDPAIARRGRRPCPADRPAPSPRRSEARPGRRRRR